jgi:anaerobic magnesium-protoporphyrin IX monomethyl ester cyclase
MSRRNIKKILLVRPPRYTLFSFYEPASFIFPLGLLSVAASIKRHLPHIEVKIVDCMALKIGWQSLESVLRQEAPDIVGAGEGIVFQHEAGRLFRLAKAVNPQVITLAGGHFFSWMVEYSFTNYPLDFIIRFEGEETVVDLLQKLEDYGGITGVQGIAYRMNGSICKNPLRPAIEDLDTLPFPEFDCLPLERYAFWQPAFGKAVNLEHSRGCIDTCTFCSLWPFWGRHLKADVEQAEFNVLPRYRTKSVERALEEVELAYNKFNRRFIFWVDPTFNVDPHWADEFCTKLMKRNYKDLHWFAHLRADFLLRDEKLGILEKMVRSGLIFGLIGVERAAANEFKMLRKSGYSTQVIREAFLVLKKKYPSVIRYATYVTCLPDETKDSLMNLWKFATKLDADFDMFYPRQIFPGTSMFHEERIDNIVETTNAQRYGFINYIAPSQSRLSSEKMRYYLFQTLLFSLLYFLRRMKIIFSPYRLKRKLFQHKAKAYLLALFPITWAIISGKKGLKQFSFRKPVWYEY